jgi:hypothetical protein
MTTRFAIVAIAVAALFAVSLVTTAPADAKGCLKGALVGGVAGHFVGHHGLLGAAAGCIIGRHEANKASRNDRNAQPQQLHSTRQGG